MRNLAVKVPTDLWPEFKTRVVACYQAPSRAIARELATGIRSDYAATLPSALSCFEPDRLTASQRRDLMEIIEDRYGRGSTLITSQLPVEAWHEVIGDPTFADAILDRLVHNAYRFALEGPSMRKPEADTDVAATTTEPTENTAQAKLAKGAKK
jgi:hypothetical protein